MVATHRDVADTHLRVVAAADPNASALVEVADVDGLGVRDRDGLEDGVVLRALVHLEVQKLNVVASLFALDGVGEGTFADFALQFEPDVRVYTQSFLLLLFAIKPFLETRYADVLQTA